MSNIKTGDRAPDFTAIAHTGERVQLSQLCQDKTVVLYFYPKDETVGCTREACSFRDAYEDFVQAGAVVVGVSADSLDSHRAFAAKYRLPFLLLEDQGGALRRAFGVPRSWGLLDGRVTYVIDSEGVVRHVFNSQIFPQRHIDEALAIVRRLAAGQRAVEATQV